MPTVIQGNKPTANFSTNRWKLDFATGIALLDPNENPFTLMTMTLNRGTSGNIAHRWLEDELQPEVDLVGDTTTAAQTSCTVDHIGRFAVGDVCMFNSSREVFLVTAVSAATDAAGHLTIVRDYAATSTSYTARAAQMVDGDYITILSNAFEQGYALPTVKGTKEVERVNYCQTVRTPFAITEIAEAADVYGENDWTYQQRKKGIEHMRKLEYQNLWGVPYAGDGSLYATTNSDPPTAGGLFYYINENASADRKVSQAEITLTEFLDFLEAGFEYGSAQKIMYCPPVLRSALDYWGITKLQTASEKNIFGMNVVKWVSSHGTVLFVTHKMLKDPGSDGAYAFLVDPDKLAWITYSTIGATRKRMLTPYEATGATVKQGEFQTISCLRVKQADCHAMLYGMTSYA